jgi:hypothetical protein
MFKKLLASVLFTGFSLSVSYAQVGSSFPNLGGETISGQRISLPKTTNGKYTLVGLAFSKKSEDELESWYNPVAARFLQDASKAGLFADFAYDVNIYFVPMFTGINKAAAGPARKKALKNVDPKLHDHILFYVGKLGDYEDSLGLEEKDQPYFFVLDPKGKIVYATDGRFTAKKMEEIESILE